MGPQLKTSNRLEKLGICHATPGLQGKQFIHYITAAPTALIKCERIISIKECGWTGDQTCVPSTSVHRSQMLQTALHGSNEV